MERCLNLGDLNEDCLSEVFSYLKLTEQLKFASITCDFNAIIAKHLQTNTFSTFECRKNFTVSESKRILDGIGCFIKRLNCDEGVNGGNIDFYNLLPDRCTNLTGVELYVSPSTDQFINFTQKLFTISNQVEDVRINISNINSHDDENMIGYKIESTLPIFPNLKILHYYSVYGNLAPVNGNNLHKFRNLVDLNIENCSGFSKDAFHSLFDSIQLQKLNIFGCTELDNNILNKMVQTQTELKDLTIDGRGFMRSYFSPEIVARLRSLKHLTFYYHSSSLIDKMLDELVTHHADDLETLRIVHVRTSARTWDNLQGLGEALPNKLVQLKNLRELIYAPFGLQDGNLEEMSVMLRKFEKFALLTFREPVITDAVIFAIATQMKCLKEFTFIGYDFNKDILQRIEETRKTFGYGILRIFVEPTSLLLFLKSKEYTDNTGVHKIIVTDKNGPEIKFLHHAWKICWEWMNTG